jgi:hypothetical protein
MQNALGGAIWIPPFLLLLAEGEPYVSPASIAGSTRVSPPAR